MPALLTHYLCGCEMLRLLENHDISALIQANRQAFNLGTQGPDFLFYHRAWPWTKGCGIDQVGEKLHVESTGLFFKTALAYAVDASDTDKQLLTAYLCGYLCHYSLDLHAHPYIFYRSGFVREGEPATRKFTSYHRRFETAIDVLMLDRLLGLQPKALDHAGLISVDKDAAMLIGQMYARIFSEAYSLSISAEQAAEAIQDMTGILAFLQDDLGWKKKLLGWLEEKKKGYPLISSLIHPQKIADGLDYLNLSHSSWHMPWDKECTSNASFVDLFEEAVQEAADMCDTLYHYIDGKLSLEIAGTCIGNRSFSSGTDCAIDLVFKFYSCIFNPWADDK